MLAASLKQRSWARSWALATLLTGVTVLGARLSETIPPTPVPITFQVFAVLLSGLLLGRRWGAVAQIQYLLLGAFNLPVFAKGNAGLPILLGITGGYLLSYPVAAFVTGWLSERTTGAESNGVLLRRLCIACAAGLLIVYGMGCSWLAVFAHKSFAEALLQGALIFLAWDAVKAAAAVGISFAARRRIAAYENR